MRLGRERKLFATPTFVRSDALRMGHPGVGDVIENRWVERGIEGGSWGTGRASFVLYLSY